MLILERERIKKRGFIGYNAKEVRLKIQSLQSHNQNELEQLHQAIFTEKEKNEKLKAQLDEINKQTSANTFDEEITLVLKNHFFQQTSTIFDLKDELTKREKVLEDNLEKKIEQREFLQERMEDALQYFKNIEIELKKELIQ